MRELRDPSRHVASSLASSLVGDASTSLASWSRRYFLLVVALPFAAAGVAAALWLAPLRARAAARTARLAGVLQAWASLDVLLLALYCAAAGAPQAALRAVAVPSTARAILEVGGEYAVSACLEEGAWWMLAAVLAHWGLHAYVLRCAREHAPGSAAIARASGRGQAAPA